MNTENTYQWGAPIKCEAKTLLQELKSNAGHRCHIIHIHEGGCEETLFNNLLSGITTHRKSILVSGSNSKYADFFNAKLKNGSLDGFTRFQPNYIAINWRNSFELKNALHINKPQYCLIDCIQELKLPENKLSEIFKSYSRTNFIVISRTSSRLVWNGNRAKNISLLFDTRVNVDQNGISYKLKNNKIA